MNLFRIFAYEVAPQRLVARTQPRGGAISNTAAIQEILDDFTSKSGLAQKQAVAFRSRESEESHSRFNPVRDLALDYVYGSGPKSAAVASQLAMRLSASMDDRSPFTLLLLSAYEQNETRRLTMWALPKEEPFHFTTRGTKAQVKLLKNAFSQSSSFRKAALLEGANRDTDFWKPRVIDKHGALGGAADYWIDTFLDSRSTMTSETGSMLLATTLRMTYDALDTRDDRDQIVNAIGAIHASKKPKWSLALFAGEYLDGNAKDAFLRRVPPESKTVQFRFSADAFDDKLNYRVFRLANNVTVSAPFDAVGSNDSAVQIRGTKRRTLSVSGEVVEEKVRAKHAG